MTSTADDDEKLHERWLSNLEAAFIFDDVPACHGRMVQEIGPDAARQVSLALALKWVGRAHKQGWVTM